MDAAAWALLGTVIGAFANNFGGEYYKRYRDTRALAFALSGELRAHLNAFETDNAINLFEDMATRAANGHEIRLPPVGKITDHVFEKNVEKIGYLEGRISRDLIIIYSNLNVNRYHLGLVADEFYGKTGSVVCHVIRLCTKRWRVTIQPTATALIDELDQIAARSLPSAITRSLGLKEFRWRRIVLSKR